jgi:hypothetical protein
MLDYGVVVAAFPLKYMASCKNGRLISSFNYLVSPLELQLKGCYCKMLSLTNWKQQGWMCR